MCTQMCSLMTAGFGGQRGPPRVQGPSSFTCHVQLWHSSEPCGGWHTGTCTCDTANVLPGQPFKNQISRGKFCSVPANIELASQMFLAGILKTNLRDGVGWSCTDSRCKWGAIVWPSHNKTFTVSSCFCKAFQHQCLCKLFGTFSCLNSVLLTILIWRGLCWARPCGVLSLEKHRARFTGLDECTQKWLEGSAKVPIQVCQS